MTWKSAFVNPDIFAMISGGIIRMKGLWAVYVSFELEVASIQDLPVPCMNRKVSYAIGARSGAFDVL